MFIPKIVRVQPVGVRQPPSAPWGRTSWSCREFPRARSAYWGTPEAPTDVSGVRFGRLGVRFGKVPTAIYRPPVRFGIILPANEKYQVGVRFGKSCYADLLFMWNCL